MLESIFVKNFRSIESSEDLLLAPITVIYGATASGKSTLMYSLLVLRNFLLNPTQQADAFFNLGFMNLGGYEACVFNHDISRQIEIGVKHKKGNADLAFSLSFSKTAATIRSTVTEFVMQAQVSIPYSLNQSFPFTFKDAQSGEEYTVNWNGITCAVLPKKPTAETQKQALEIATYLNSSSEVLKGIDIAPHKRGFFKPYYTPVPTSPTPTSEDEVASLIINDPHMAGRISVYLEEIFGRDFRLYIAPGTATAYFQTTDKKSRIPVYLINDGFGINQVVYLLAKMLRMETGTILIEEPEVHMHPTVIRNFVRVLCAFVKEEKKQIILTTHSEQFLISLLTAVSEGILHPDDVKCHLAVKDKKHTAIKEQKIGKEGQIEGGLSSFMEAETEDLKKFLGIK